MNRRLMIVEVGGLYEQMINDSWVRRPIKYRDFLLNSISKSLNCIVNFIWKIQIVNVKKKLLLLLLLLKRNCFCLVFFSSKGGLRR